MSDYKTVPNQRVVRMPSTGERIRDKEHLYGMFNIEEAQKVAKELGSGAFVLYMYFQKNQDCYEFALSKEDVNNWGLGKTAYTNAFNLLAANGYLVRKSKKSNFYYFHETPELNEDGTPVVVLHNHEDDNDNFRGNATTPRVVSKPTHAWQRDNTTRGSVTLPEIIHNNTIDNKINNTIYSAPDGAGGSGASAATATKKNNDEEYQKIVKEINDRYFDLYQQAKVKYGADFEDNAEYKEQKQKIYDELAAVKEKFGK